MARSLKPFDYFEPHTIKEAVSILGKHGKNAKVLAGGVDLVARMRLRQTQPKYVVSLVKIPKLDYISRNKRGLKFGVLTSIRALELSPVIQKDYNVLYEAASKIASIQVKNMGTAVGNICVATPASDIASALFVLDAELRIMSPNGERTIPIDNFYQGVNKTVLKPDEIVIEVILPSSKPQQYGAFIKMIRTASDIAKVNVAVQLELVNGICKNVRIALGSVASTVIRSVVAEKKLSGKKLSSVLIKEAADLASKEVVPITDLRSTADYRKGMVKVLVRRAIQEALAKAG